MLSVLDSLQEITIYYWTCLVQLSRMYYCNYCYFIVKGWMEVERVVRHSVGVRERKNGLDGVLWPYWRFK